MSKIPLITKERFILKNFRTTENKDDKMHNEKISKLLQENRYVLSVVDVGRIFNSLNIGKHSHNVSIKNAEGITRIKAGFEYIFNLTKLRIKYIMERRMYWTEEDAIGGLKTF